MSYPWEIWDTSHEDIGMLTLGYWSFENGILGYWSFEIGILVLWNWDIWDPGTPKTHASLLVLVEISSTVTAKRSPDRTAVTALYVTSHWCRSHWFALKALLLITCNKYTLKRNDNSIKVNITAETHSVFSYSQTLTWLRKRLPDWNAMTALHVICPWLIG